ncbi:hypothetical protein BJ508DRAFT_165096 [Ascobolus immersus RN42]|uniref:Uncharacterized protein n=1 Tax=Ascobolus immersus RN42 TaxID=1160509 RepID=A0A3N4I0H0_ASCIM|nr:hypothetical protein BJ508DRAFT_165096 [Ascobolus immersus RN42]
MSFAVQSTIVAGTVPHHYSAPTVSYPNRYNLRSQSSARFHIHHHPYPCHYHHHHHHHYYHQPSFRIEDSFSSDGEDNDQRIDGCIPSASNHYPTQCPSDPPGHVGQTGDPEIQNALNTPDGLPTRAGAAFSNITASGHSTQFNGNIQMGQGSIVKLTAREIEIQGITSLPGLVTDRDCQHRNCNKAHKKRITTSKPHAMFGTAALGAAIGSVFTGTYTSAVYAAGRNNCSCRRSESTAHSTSTKILHPEPSDTTTLPNETNVEPVAPTRTAMPFDTTRKQKREKKSAKKRQHSRQWQLIGTAILGIQTLNSSSTPTIQAERPVPLFNPTSLFSKSQIEPIEEMKAPIQPEGRVLRSATRWPRQDHGIQALNGSSTPTIQAERLVPLFHPASLFSKSQIEPIEGKKAPIQPEGRVLRSATRWRRQTYHGVRKHESLSRKARRQRSSGIELH